MIDLDVPAKRHGNTVWMSRYYMGLNMDLQQRRGRAQPKKWLLEIKNEDISIIAELEIYPFLCHTRV